MTQEQIERANAMRPGTLMETLDIRFVPSEAGTFAATMPVTPVAHQPMGLLHGGATVALAESLGSAGSAMLVDLQQRSVVGIEVNANHVKAVRSGLITATGRLAHQGRTTHVWDIRVTNEAGELVALCRLTTLITERRP